MRAFHLDMRAASSRRGGVGQLARLKAALERCDVVMSVILCIACV